MKSEAASSQKADYLIASTENHSQFFVEIVGFLCSELSLLEIAFWDLDEEISRTLEGFRAENVPLKAKIFKEKKYAVDIANKSDFLNIIKDVDFSKTQWAISIDDKGIVLARETDDINVCLFDLISSSLFEQFLKVQKENGCISEYHVVED